MMRSNGPVAMVMDSLDRRVFVDSSLGGHRGLAKAGNASSTPANASMQRLPRPPPSTASDTTAPAVKELQVFRLVSPTADACAVGTHTCEVGWKALKMPEDTNFPDQGSRLPALDVTYQLELQQVGEAYLHPNLPQESSLKPSEWRCAYKGDALCHKLEGLRSGKLYAIRVRATVQQPTNDECVRIDVDNSKAVFVQTLPTVPSAPPPPALISRERKALKLKWVPPEDTGGCGPLTYVLYQNPAPSDAEATSSDVEGFVEVYRGVERSQKISKLQPGTRYRFCLKAINYMGEGPLGLYSAFTTQATVPAAPDAPQVVAATETSIMLQWHAPADNGSPISLYTLEKDDGEGGDMRMVYAGVATTATISNLRSGLHYRFRLRAENDEGKSNWSSVMVASTAACPPGCPCALGVVAVTRTSATMSWQPSEDDGGSCIQAYEVELQGKGKAAVEHMGTDWLKIFEGEATACTINSLRAGCTYRARVRACSSAGWGQFSIPVEIATDADVPDQPDPPTVAALQSTWVTLTWQPPRHDGGSKVVGHRLEVFADKEGSFGDELGAELQASKQLTELKSCGTRLVYSGDACEAQVSGLQPGFMYHFHVQAINAQGPGAWSDWLPVTMLASVPLVPNPPAASAISSTSVILQWEAPLGQGAPVMHFTLEHAQQQDSSSDAAGHAAVAPAFRQLYRGPHLSYEAKGLEPATSYLFRVAALNSVGSSPFSEATAVMTAPAAPSVPEAVAAVAASSSEVVVSWQAPARSHGMPVTQYALEYYLLPQSFAAAAAAASARKASGQAQQVAWQRAYSGSEASCQVQQLQPGKAYQFRVQAANACGSGPFSAPVTASTLAAPPCAPVRLSFAQRTANSVRVKWESPDEDNGAAVTSYVLEHCIEHSDNWQVAYSGREAAAKVQRLLPGTCYWFRVAACNSAGTGPFTAHEAVSTMLAPPGPPEAVEVVEMGQLGADPAGSCTAITTADHVWVHLRWQPPIPSATSAVPTSYEIAAVPASSSNQSGSVHGAHRATATRGATECRLEPLLPGTRYAVRLRAVGAEGTGHSAWGPELLFTAPGKPVAQSTDSDSVRSLFSESSALTVSVSGGSATAARNGSLISAKVAQASKRGSGRSKGNSGSTSSGPTAPSTSGDSEDGSVAGMQSNAASSRKTGSKAKVVAAVTRAAARAPPMRRTLAHKARALIGYWGCRVLIVALVCALLRILTA